MTEIRNQDLSTSSHYFGVVVCQGRLPPVTQAVCWPGKWGCWSILVCLGLISWTAGCRDQPVLAPVSGRVLYADGRPVCPGTIWFIPEIEGLSASKKGSALLQTDGTFTLATYPYGPGVPPGAYRITFSLGANTTQAVQDFLHFEKTPLRVSVPPAGLSDYQVTLPVAKSQSIPAGPGNVPRPSRKN